MNAPRDLPTLEFVQLYKSDAIAIRRELSDGLLRPQASTSPKFFYNALGSSLFDAITRLDEYYPTRTEAAIFAEHGAAMAAAVHASVGDECTLIDLGAANCAKAASLFEVLQPAQYVAVDISTDFLRAAMTALQQRHRTLPMLGVGMDFSANLELPAQVRDERRLFFYPGSSIGNFAPSDALAFLKRLRVGGNGLLIGVDNVKGSAQLEAAYDDALGVTAAFNLNALLNINALIGADFAVRDWQHVARYDTALQRIEMLLQARRDLTVRWGAQQRKFAAGERIHTENSYKYTPAGFTALLNEAGFTKVQHWTDPQAWFSVYFAS
jgi:L-histidine Nalpha-methyltransferase